MDVLVVRHGGSATVTVALEMKAADGYGIPVTARTVLRADQSTGRVRLEAAKPGAYLIRAMAPGFWAAPAWGTSSLPAELALWPTGEVHGTLRPQEASTGLQLTFDGVGDQAGLHGVTPCGVSVGTFRCAVPAGMMNLAVRAPGFGTKRFWEQKLLAGMAVDLGTLEVVPGGSAIGTLRRGDSGPLNPAVARVRLVRIERSKREESAKPIAWTTSITRGGFFQFDGLESGDYAVTATQDGLRALAQRMVVLGTTESCLATPLLLTAPHRIDLHISPPVDPAGKAWRVELLESRNTRTRLAATSIATPTGLAHLADLVPAREYQVRVTSSSGDAWFTDATTFAVNEPVTERQIVIDVFAVEGRVRLGSLGREMTLVFGTPHGLESLRVMTDTEGRFAAALPRLGKWTVSVTANAPRVVREMLATVRAGEPVEFSFPENQVSFEVVDVRGQPAPETVLKLRRNGDQPAIVVVDSGQISLAGLDDGEYEVRARARGLSSDTYRLIVHDAVPDQDTLRVVLKPAKSIQGHVVDAFGSPVINASVYLTSTAPPSEPVDAVVATEVDGRFQANIPSQVNALCAVIAADSVPSRTVHLSVTEGEQEVTMPPGGGSLSLEYPVTGTDALGGRFAVLFSGGCVFTPAALRGARTVVEGRRTLVTMMEPGAYTLCAVNHPEYSTYGGGSPRYAKCVSGDLPAQGRLNLKLLP